MAKVKNMTDTEIEEVNGLLKLCSTLPIHRSYIDSSGANLKWLKKKLTQLPAHDTIRAYPETISRLQQLLGV